MSFRHELREAWTLGKDDLNKVIKVSGEGWTFVGRLKKVDVAHSVLAEARNRFSRANSSYLAVVVWVGPFTGAIPARALVTVEHEELEAAPTKDPLVLEGKIVEGSLVPRET